jgi:hypothetical protein
MKTLLLGSRGFRGGSFRVAAIGAAAFLLLSLFGPGQDVPLARAATEWYVAPGISSGSGTGSQSSPWNIQFALSGANSAVKPGDTVWLRGGTYTGCVNANLNGTAAAPIWVKQYPNERAKLDTGSVCPEVLLNISGSYTNYMGFEVTNSYTGWPAGGNYGGFPSGVSINTSSNIKLINLIVHDMNGQGIGAWTENNTAEIYGSIIYYNGQTDHDHGVYLQNLNGTKRVVDNFIFHQASHGTHGYGSTDAYIDNLHFEGNTAFNNGLLGPNEPSRNFLLGGLVVAKNLTFNNNNTYFPQSIYQGDAINLGYSAGCTNAAVNNNYSYGSDVNIINCQTNSFAGNQFYAREFAGFNPSSYPGNTFQAAIPAPKPTTNKVVVRPNQYESGRANITIYNWQNQTSVSVPVSGILNSGDTYQLRNVQDYFSDIITGIYNGSGNISVPMTGRTIAKPLKYNAPASSFPEFGGFVLIKTGSTPTPPPPPPPPAPTPVPPPPAPTPVPPPPPAGPAYIYMEAESGSLVSPMVTGSDANAFNGQYVTTATANSGTDTITFNAPSSGSYVIWGRVLAPNSDVDSTFVSVDNGTEEIYDMAEGTWSNNWQWSQVKLRLNNNPATLQQRAFNLSAGSHTVKFRGRETNSKLDRVLITNDLSFVPTASPNPAPPPPPAPTPVPPPPPANQPVEGSFDEITSTGIMRGWTLDRDNSSASTQFHIYLNGQAGQGGTLIGSTTANVSRPDVNQALGVTGNHGFEFSVPSAYRNGTTYAAYVYGIDLNDSTGNRLLIGSPKNFNLSAPVPPPPAPTPTPAPSCTTVNTNSFFGCYYQGINFETLKLTRTDNSVNFNWGVNAPDPLVPVDYFSAKWTGNFTFEAANYEFSVTADDGVRLYVDNILVIDQWRDQSATNYRVTRNMTAGSHQVKMEYYERGADAVAQLAWIKSGTTPPPPPPPAPSPTGTGLAGAYFNNANFTNQSFSRTDSTVNFNWGEGSPDPRIADTSFSIRWTGQIQPQYSQTYTFYIVSDDGIRLWVNNQLIINNWTDHPPTENSGTIALVAGIKYDIKLEYYENSGGAVAQLAWSSSSQPKQIIPQVRLYPGAVAGESIEAYESSALIKAYGDPTVYLVTDNKLMPFTSEEHLRSYGFILAQAKEVSPEAIKKYTVQN